jgi:NTP pyrophosphatase (non-canonical NTP hydrolase)
MATDLLEEAGEVAAVIKGLEGFKPPEKPKTREMLATELSDLLYIIFVLAEHYGVELNESFPRTVNGYMRRFTKNRSQDGCALWLVVCAHQRDV